MLDDPLDVPAPFQRRQEEPDFRREFWAQVPDMRSDEGRENPGTMYICRYLHGIHEMPPRPWCPHFRHEDETGRRVRESWTAQDDWTAQDG